MNIYDDPDDGSSQSSIYTFYVIIIDEVIITVQNEDFSLSDWYPTPALES